MQNAPHLLDAYARLPAEVLSLDWRTDIAGAQTRYPDRAVQGNLDPAVLLSDRRTVRTAVENLLRRVAPGRHVVNLGHGVLPDTPLENVETLVRIVREEQTP